MLYKLFLFICVLLPLGCGLPLGTRDVNNKLFADSTELENKFKKVQLGMEEEKVFSALGIKPNTPNLQVLSTEEAKTLLYGNAEVRGGTADLETFKSKLASIKGYKLPYILIERSGSLGLFKWTVERSGHDQSVVMVFDKASTDKAKLIKVSLEGRRNVQEKETSYLWEIIWSSISGASEDSARAAAKSATGTVLP